VYRRKASRLRPEAAKCVAGNAGLVDEVSREIRKISHLLHPPLADEPGGVGLRWYTKGSRSAAGSVELEIPGSGRLPNERGNHDGSRGAGMLTNIHRHFRKRDGEHTNYTQGTVLCLSARPGEGELLRKSCKGSPTVGQIGVGFTGMRERLEATGGTLEIQVGEKDKL